MLLPGAVQPSMQFTEGPLACRLWLRCLSQQQLLCPTLSQRLSNSALHCQTLLQLSISRCVMLCVHAASDLLSQPASSMHVVVQVHDSKVTEQHAALVQNQLPLEQVARRAVCACAVCFLAGS